MNVDNLIANGYIFSYNVYHSYKMETYHIQYVIITYKCFNSITIWKSVFIHGKDEQVKCFKIAKYNELINF